MKALFNYFLTALLAMFCWHHSMVKASGLSEHCQHQGEKYLVGQRILLPDYQTREVVWMTCTRSSNNASDSTSPVKPSWVVGITDGYRDDLLEQARLKAISARTLKKQLEKVETENHSPDPVPAESVNLPAHLIAPRKKTRLVMPQEKAVPSINYSELAVKQQEYEQEIINRIQQHWIPPLGETGFPACKASVFKGIKGSIVEVVFRDCAGSRSYRASVKAAILKSEPWPLPDIPELYQPEITLTFNPPG